MLRKTNKLWLATAILALGQTGYTTAQDGQHQRITLNNSLAGAAFVVSGVVTGKQKTELLVSSFGEFSFGAQGPVPPAAGKVTLFTNFEPGNTPNGQVEAWASLDIVTEDDGITFPNLPLVAHVNNDRKPDVIVPGGYFFDGFLGNSRGSITWWENRSKNTQWGYHSHGRAANWDLNPPSQNSHFERIIHENDWVRHDVVTNSPFSYHSVLFEDFNGDYIKDIVSVGENAGNPSDPFDDVVEVHLFAGKGNGRFADAITIGAGGGSLISAYDVNGDGNMDVVSPQFFGSVAGQPFVPLPGRDTDTASYVWYENMGNGTFTKHAIGIDQGPGFAIVPVPNLLGDGITRWVASNHTNQNVDFAPFSLYPEPSVYVFTPGEDPSKLWDVSTLSAPGDFPVEGGVGQAAPGFLAPGDLDGDGRIDIAVSGDGARGVFWLQQQDDGHFVTHQFPDSDGYGQAGGPVVEDINRSGSNEVIFSSFDQNAVSIWKR